jgi:hypothetical protein
MKQTVWVQLSLDVDVADAEQEFGWYYFHPASTTSDHPVRRRR